MTYISYENELRKREFFVHLRGAKGFADDSVDSYAEAIDQWQIFSENDDFKNYDKEKAIRFREWLRVRETKTKAKHLSLTTIYHYLRRVKKFFSWLSEQPGYKNKVSKNDIEFLRLSKKDARIATSGTTKQMPTFEEAKRIIEGIEVKNEIDKRDRALISFALITGMRISAIVTLKMKNFDKMNRWVYQNPGDGVQTKNSKTILTAFFPIHDWVEPERYFMEWYEYLESKGFQLDQPIFPSTLNGFGSASSYSKDAVGGKFWSDSGGARKIFEKRCKNVEVPYFHPHSFRHLIVNIMSKTRLTEEEKRAISLNLGHENVGTTFGSYGYGSMSGEDAVRIVQKLKDTQNNQSGLAFTEEEKALLGRLIGLM